jgi:hypothetical protein
MVLRPMVGRGCGLTRRHLEMGVVPSQTERDEPEHDEDERDAAEGIGLVILRFLHEARGIFQGAQSSGWMADWSAALPWARSGAVDRVMGCYDLAFGFLLGEPSHAAFPCGIGPAPERQ